MKRAILPMFLLAAATLSSCDTPSAYPLFSEDTKITDSALVGTWRETDKKEKDTYTISPEGDHYLLVVDNHDSKERHKWKVEMHLLQLGKHRFLEIEAPSKGKEGDDFENFFFLPTSYFARYAVEGESVKLWMLKTGWVEDQAGKLSQARIPGLFDPSPRILITAKTKDLQAFLESHTEDPEAFEESEFKRAKP